MKALIVYHQGAPLTERAIVEIASIVREFADDNAHVSCTTMSDEELAKLIIVENKSEFESVKHALNYIGGLFSKSVITDPTAFAVNVTSQITHKGDATLKKAIKILAETQWGEWPSSLKEKYHFNIDNYNAIQHIVKFL